MCRELVRHGIACIDTDDVARVAHDKTNKSTYEQLLRARVDSCRGLVVLAGMYHIPDSLSFRIVERLALRPSPRQIGATYRRYLLRNLENVKRHARDIRAAIESTRSPRDIQHVIGHAVMINADLVMSYDVFKAHVEAAATNFRKLGYRVMTQNAALKAIVNYNGRVIPP
jgi:hypothetical protein